MSDSIEPNESRKEESRPPLSLWKRLWKRIWNYLLTMAIVIGVAVFVEKINEGKNGYWLSQTNRSLNDALLAANPINALHVFGDTLSTRYSFEQKLLDNLYPSKIPGLRENYEAEENGFLGRLIEIPFFVVHLIHASLLTTVHILFPNVIGFIIGLAAFPVVVVPAVMLASRAGILGFLVFPLMFALAQSILIGLIMLVSLPLEDLVTAPMVVAFTSVISTVPGRAVLEHHITRRVLKLVLKRA
jgi:hypothetical protein